MQGIDFAYVKNDGLYLIVTFLEKWFTGSGGYLSIGGGGGSSSNTLYAFFQIENGKAVAYSGYSLGRDDSFRRKSQKGFIKYRDLVKVLKRMYRK